MNGVVAKTAHIIKHLRAPAEHAVLDADEDSPDDNWDDLGLEGRGS